MKTIKGWIIVFLVSVYAAPAAEPKKLIEFGWDEPSTAFLREHAEQLDQSPFDGTVFHADYRTDKAKGSFTWQGWGTNAFNESDLREAIADLKATRFQRLHWNFLRFNTTPAKLDWFDDYRAVETNAWLAARVAKLGHCPGLLFDIEQYEGQLFDYRKQRDRDQKSWDIYAAQVRQRGRETMEAFQRAYPDLTVFLTFGYSLPWTESAQGKGPLSECHYGLLAPFLDGILETARGRTKIVDGYEISYGYLTSEQFESAYQRMKSGVLPVVARPDQYGRHMSFGFGLWLDYQWRKRGWDSADPEENYFSPDKFREGVRSAIRVADEFVWIYSETPRWWSDSGASVKLPPIYVKILREAR